MIQQDEGDGINHRTNEADHGGNENQRTGLIQLYGDGGDHREQEQEEKIPLAVDDVPTLRKKTVDAVGVSAADGIDGGKPGVGKKRRSDDQKQDFSPPTPTHFEKPALNHGYLVTLRQELFGKQQRVGQQAGKQRGNEISNDAYADVPEQETIPVPHMGESFVVTRKRTGVRNRLWLAGNRSGEAAHVVRHARALVTNPIRIK